MSADAQSTMIQATHASAERDRGFDVGHYVRFWPDGESGTRWMEGEVTRVHEGIVLESRGWSVLPLAADARIDPSYDLLRQGVLRHAERATAWPCRECAVTPVHRVTSSPRHKGHHAGMTLASSPGNMSRSPVG